MFCTKGTETKIFFADDCAVLFKDVADWLNSQPIPIVVLNEQYHIDDTGRVQHVGKILYTSTENYKKYQVPTRKYFLTLKEMENYLNSYTGLLNEVTKHENSGSISQRGISEE